MDLLDKDNINKSIQNNIDEYGCEIVEIEGNEYFPSYSYTIGLFQQFNHPEIICFGLSSDSMTSILNQIKSNIEEEQAIYESKKMYEGFLTKGYEITFLEVKKEYYKEYLDVACEFYNSEEFPCLEFIWPDKAHLFPWQEKFDIQSKFIQPLLDRNTDFFFLEDRDMMVFTTQNILDKKKEILFVEHDEDGDWFFLEAEDIDENNILTTTLDQIVKIDNSINDLIALNYNQIAFRNNLEEEWILEQY